MVKQSEVESVEASLQQSRWGRDLKTLLDQGDYPLHLISKEFSYGHALPTNPIENCVTSQMGATIYLDAINEVFNEFIKDQL